MLKGIVIAFFCSILLFLIHFIILFTLHRERRYSSPMRQIFDIARLLIKICICLFIVYTLMFFLIPDGFFQHLILKLFASLEIFNFFYGIVLYFCLFFLYLIFYFIVARSVTAKIMIELENSPPKELTLKDIEEAYNVNRKYLDELEGMLQGKFITKDSDYFSNTIKGRLYCRMARFLKGFFKFGPGG